MLACNEIQVSRHLMSICGPSGVPAETHGSEHKVNKLQLKKEDWSFFIPPRLLSASSPAISTPHFLVPIT